MNHTSFRLPAVATCFLLGAFSAAAQNVNKPLSLEPLQRPVAAASAVQASAEVFLAQAAVNAGLRTCKPLADRVNRYLIAEGQSSGLLSAAPENANMRIFSSTIEIESRQGTTTYASTTYAPYADAGCGVAYDAVTYWKESCAEVASTALKQLRPVGTLGNKINMLDGGPAMRMFLMPAGSGCVQIKKEILY